MAFSPDGRQVLTGSSDNTARLWEAATGKPLATLSGHAGPVRAVAFSPDGRQMLTGSFDSTARLWEAATGKPLATLSGHAGPVGAVAFSARRPADADRLSRQHGAAVGGGHRQATGDAQRPRRPGLGGGVLAR